VNAIFILVAASAIVGLILGLYLPVLTILASALVLAFFSAAVLHNQGFGPLAGIATIAGCLAINQIAYLVGAALTPRGLSVPLAHDQSRDDPCVAPSALSHYHPNNVRSESNRKYIASTQERSARPTAAIAVDFDAADFSTREQPDHSILATFAESPFRLPIPIQTILPESAADRVGRRSTRSCALLKRRCIQINPNCLNLFIKWVTRGRVGRTGRAVSLHPAFRSALRRLRRDVAFPAHPAPRPRVDG
jgi:hypothetical protein